MMNDEDTVLTTWTTLNCNNDCNLGYIHWQPMIRTEFEPKVVVNPYEFARICTALFPGVALKRLKNSYGLYMSSCGSFSVQQVPGSRTAPGFGFYIFVSL